MLTGGARVRLALATLLTGVLAATGAMIVSGPDVLAAPPECENTPDSTDCGIAGGIGGQPGGGGGNGGGNGGGGGTGSCSWRGKPVVCFDPNFGSFNANDGCYYRVADPQPANVPEGMINYLRSCIDNNGLQVPVDLEAPPELVPPDPAEIAAQILARISFPAPKLAFAPSAPGVLGLPVWMWVSNGAADPKPTESDSASGITVTLTAEMSRVEWSMGDGTTVTCPTGGEPWTSDKGRSVSPTCGYPMAGASGGYQRAGTYPVSATVVWQISWTAPGDDGVLLDVRTPTTTVDYQVNELQVVNR